jgi:hypothetical protein
MVAPAWCPLPLEEVGKRTDSEQEARTTLYAAVKLEVLTNWEVLRKIGRYSKPLTAI